MTLIWSYLIKESLEYAHDFKQVITNITNSAVATVDGHNLLMDVKFGYVFLKTNGSG